MKEAGDGKIQDNSQEEMRKRATRRMMLMRNAGPQRAIAAA
jgi:hypothetical protein